MILLATVLMLLGLLYLFWAIAWHWLFNREALRHAEPEESGYRIGRLVYWRPPKRLVLFVSGLCILPAAAVILFDRLMENLLLLATSGALLALWLVASPGRMLHYAETGRDESQPVFELTGTFRPARAAAILLVLGLLPAFVVGSLLSAFLGQVVPNLR